VEFKKALKKFKKEYTPIAMKETIKYMYKGPGMGEKNGANFLVPCTNKGLKAKIKKIKDTKYDTEVIFFLLMVKSLFAKISIKCRNREGTKTAKRYKNLETKSACFSSPIILIKKGKMVQIPINIVPIENIFFTKSPLFLK